MEIDPNHDLANRYQATVQKKWHSLQEKLAQTQPCNVCRYYYGKNGLTCAVHPSGRPEELCWDWEF
ncbi:MAG TPA: hypothetical protein V6D35_09410 [Candidatus Sericytochromatia bacterium]